MLNYFVYISKIWPSGDLARVLCLCLLFATKADAQQSEELDEALLGSWGGLRPRLEQAGISPSVEYRFLPIGNYFGGIRQGTVWMDNVDFSLTTDLDRAAGLPNTTLFLYGLYNHGQLLTPYVGDIQVVSNIETPTRLQLFEGWIETRFFNDRFSVLAGKYDLNSEFDLILPGKLFLHSSFGIGVDYSQSGFAGPSIFPWSTPGIRLLWQPSGRIRMLLLAADASPAYSGLPAYPDGNDGYLYAGEMWFGLQNRNGAVKSSCTGGTAPFSSHQASRIQIEEPLSRFTLGGWIYSSAFNDLETGLRNESFKNSGMYVSVQQYLFSSDSDRFVAGFLRAGWANHRFNQFGSSFTGGISGQAELSGRPFQYGAGFSHARNGETFASKQRNDGLPATRAETALEITATVEAANGVTFQPDLQWIINPGTSRLIPDAWIAALQLTLTF